MGLLNVRNLQRAKALLEQNRHRVGDVVSKAGDTLDKVSSGKTASVTAKASDAARKYSEGTGPNYGTEVPVDSSSTDRLRDDDGRDAQVRQAPTSESAATAVKGAADALTNLLNKAAARVEAQNAAPNPDVPPQPGTDR